MFENFMDIQPDTWKEGQFEAEALASQIKILGVGGGGSNAVETIYNFNFSEYDGKKMQCGHFVCNTDSQALLDNKVPNKILLGDGLGAGCNQADGREKARKDIAKLKPLLDPELTKVLFIAAGMGGGTGTGAAPIIASEAKSAGILTIAVVTMPFEHEGARKYSDAVDGVLTLKDCVDCLILVDNNKLYESQFAEELFINAFPYVDKILATAVIGITSTIKKAGRINIDLRDTKNMLTNGGLTLVGHGVGKGEDRLEDAVNQAFDQTLLLDCQTQTASEFIWNLTISNTAESITVSDHQKLAKLIKERTGEANSFKSGITYSSDPDFGDKIELTIIATGIDMSHLDELIDKDKTSFVDIDESYTFTKDAFLKEKIARTKSNKKKKNTEKTRITTGGARIIANQGPKFHFTEEPLLATTDQAEIKEYSKRPAFYREKDHE